MKTCKATLKSASAYSQSRHHATEKLEKEGHDAYERRTWPERMHYDQAGEIFIPPMSFKNCIAEAAKYLSVGIPGKGKSTYTKHFEAGILVPEPSYIGVQKTKAQHEWLFVPSDGRRGGGTRVMKCFPLFLSWSTIVTFYIFDDTIPKDVFKYHLVQAGSFIGIGRFRPRNNGYYGRFNVEELEWGE